VFVWLSDLSLRTQANAQSKNSAYFIESAWTLLVQLQSARLDPEQLQRPLVCSEAGAP
jgi:hypothetical protein